MQKLKWRYLVGVSGSLLLMWQLAWHPLPLQTAQGMSLELPNLMPLATQVIAQAGKIRSSFRRRKAKASSTAAVCLAIRFLRPCMIAWANRMPILPLAA
jgi:hypothetical protein